MPRYFLMRVADQRLFERAAAACVWPVGYGAVERLNEAFATGEPVTLIFTISLSGSFQGAARMLCQADQATARQLSVAGSLPACRIEWIRRADLPYAEAEHLVNPLSDPPQPVRAGKDGTEIDASVAEELLSLLERAPPPTHRPKPSPRTDGGIGDGGGGGARPPGGGTLGGPPALVGQGLMGMADPSMLMGMNPLMAMNMMNSMMNPMMAGMMNPMAAAMMMGSLQGMMPGMRPPGAVAPPPAGGGEAAVKPEAGKAAEPSPTADGLPPGFGGGAGRGREREREADGGRYEWERERYHGRYDGPRFRDGPPPPFRDGPPPRDFDRPFDRGGRYDRGPPPPEHWGRGYDGPPGGPPPPMRPRDDRPDLLRMTYEEYVARFNHLKELQNGGSGDKPGGDKPGGADGGLAAEGKENSGGAPLAIEAPPEKAASGGGGEEGAPVDGGAAPPDLAAMGEEEYVEYCKRASAQAGLPFDAELARQHYRAARGGGGAAAAPS